MSGFVDQLKAQLSDPRSTRELTLILGERAEQQGRQDIFAQHPDFGAEYAALKDEIARLNRPSFGKEFTGALGSAVDSAQASGLGLLKLGADVVGADSVGAYLGDQVAEQNRQAAEYHPSVPSYRDVHGVEDAARYGLYAAGTVLPSLAIGAASGGVGALAGRALGGAIGGAVAETAGAAAARLAGAARTGSQIGLAGSSIGQEVGSIYNDTGAAGPSVGFGIAAGLLDVIPEAYVIGKFFPGAHEIAGNEAREAVGYWRRFATEAAKVVPMEATTEGAQTLLEISAGKYARGEPAGSFTEDDYRQALNAGVIGGIGGALMAPFAAIPGPRGDSAVTPAGEAPPPAPAPTTIPTAGLPPEVAAAVESAEAASDALIPQPTIPNAISQQSTGALGFRPQEAVGAPVGEGNAQPEIAAGARQPGSEAGQAQEAVISAAVKDASGTVRQGQIHALIEGFGEPGSIDGYLTDKGRFVLRDEADALARKRIKMSVRGDLNAEEIDDPIRREAYLEAELQAAKPGETERIARQLTETRRDIAARGYVLAGDRYVLAGTPAINPKPLDPAWKVTVQSAMGDIPGFIQIDKVGPGGERAGFASPEQLRAQGYDVPDFAQLPQGQYTVDDALKAKPVPSMESKAPEPTVENVLPVPEAKEAVRAQTPEPLTLESATHDQQADEARVAREREAALAQQEEIAAGIERPLTGDSSDVGQGQLLAQDENLFSGPSAETVAQQPTQSAVVGLPVVEVPIEQVTLSKDVPQFKADANEQGVVEPLQGKFDRRGQVLQGWRRANGQIELISGRHRFDLAKRSGEKTVPLQIHDEAAGFDKMAAASLDAELNIRDGQGTIGDYSNYFRNAGVTEADAQARGLLARDKGRAGFQIANAASEDLFALHQAGRVSDEAAVAISRAAPGNDGAQAVGVKAVLAGKSGQFAANLVQAAMARADAKPATQGDLFSFDDSAMREMEQQATMAAAIQRDLRDKVLAVEGAARRPATASKLGVNISDPAALQERLGKLKGELVRWQNWPMHPDLVAQTKVAPELRFTQRTSADYLNPTISGVRLLDSTVRALATDRGIAVTPMTDAITAAGDSAIKGAGLTLTPATGQRMVAYAVDAIHGPMAPQSVISLLHEAGHVFTDGLEDWQRVAAQRAISELPFTAQRWLNNTQSLDARLLATADPETLSAGQRMALKQMTAQEIAAARALPTEALVAERMAEHLAQLGWDKKQATTFVDRLFRFVKDLWLKTAMAIQTALKGEDQVNPELARQFVENRFLQFINRDAAYAESKINDLRNWIGVPQTTRERQPNFPAGSDNEMRMQYADRATGTLIPISYGTYTPDSVRAYLQRAIDNAARVVRDQPAGAQSPDQIAYTKRVNFQKPLPLEPSATYNVKLAALNLEDEIYNALRENRNIANLLPREKGQPIDHAAFLADWMKLPEQQHPTAIKAEVLSAAAEAIDPLTGQPVAHDPDAKLNQLPAAAETLIGKEKEPVQIQLSEQQDEALTQTILSLRDTQRRMQRTLTQESNRLNDLVAQRAEQKAEFPKDAETELDELQRTTLLRSEILKALIPRISDLESKFDPRTSVNIYPTAEYLRIPSPTADEAEILDHRKGVVPRDLNFSSDATKSALGQDLAAMEEWLGNPDNRRKGAIYGTVDETYRKLMQIPTDLKRVHTAVLLRRTITNGLAEELRLTGIPSLVAFGKKIIQVARIANENRVESHNLGVKWEVAFSTFAKAMGAQPDQTFRDTWWDPLNRIWDRVDVSRRTELKSPTEWRTPIDQVAKALNQVAGLEIRTEAQRQALRDLMLVTTDNNRHFMSVELQNDIRVQDDKLRFERRLIPRGVIGGRRTFARHLMGLFARMNPDWSDTSFVSAEDTRSFWDAAGDLYNEDRGAFDKQMKKLFPSYVISDFVEPWVNDNDPVFQAPSSGEDSTPRMAAPNRVRRAWKESGGDITHFAEILHAAEGGEPDGESATVASVLRTLRNKFYQQKTAVDQQLGRQNIGSEIIPRQLMDARVAHNWPAEHVSYATYTPVDNAMVLNQLALGASLGRDALGDRSEMHMTLAEARRDLAQLWSQHEQLVRDGMSPNQVEAIMGRDDARIARNYYALTDNIKHIEQAIVGMTMNSGYLLQDFKAMNAAIGFFSSMMVQNPRSGAVNIIGDVLGSLAALKFSSQGLRAFRDSATSVSRDMATAIVRAFGVDAKFNTDLAHELYVNGAVEPEAAVTWRQKQHFGAGMSQTKPSGYETTGAKIARVITRGASRGREIAPNVGSPFQVAYKPGDEQAAVAPKLRAGFFGTTAMSTQLANNRAGYNLFAQLANRGVAYLSSLPEATREAAVRELELGTRDLDSRQLGYQTGTLLNDQAAFDYLKNAISTQMSGESSVGRFVAKAFRRKEGAADGKWAVLSNSQFSDVINLTNSYWTLQNNFATIPPWMNGPLRPLFIFLTWPYQAMHRFGQTFTDPRGRLTFDGLNSTVADGLKTFFLLAAPATIAGSFAIDLYDKYALGKKQNLREASLATALPGVGAIVDPRAFMERIGRYGSAGFATDLMNRIVNYDTQRNLSLDDRIVAVSSIESLLNAVAVEPFQTGGNITYSSTVRPFLQAIGGGGVLQYYRILGNMLGFNDQEMAINNQINATNILRAAGRELGTVHVRVMTGPMEAPSPMSPYIRQMSLGALVDNPELFRAAYQNALAVARSEGKDEKAVAEAFVARHPLRRPFAVVPTDTQYRQMLSLAGDKGASDVQTAVNNYNRYSASFFGRQPFYGRVEKDGPSIEQLIREASSITRELAEVPSF